MKKAYYEITARDTNVRLFQQIFGPCNKKFEILNLHTRYVEWDSQKYYLMLLSLTGPI
jgi:hypothetical protein